MHAKALKTLFLLYPGMCNTNTCSTSTDRGDYHEYCIIQQRTSQTLPAPTIPHRIMPVDDIMVEGAYFNCVV